MVKLEMPRPYNPADIKYPREILFTCAKGAVSRNAGSRTPWTEGTAALWDSLYKSQKQNFG